MTAEQLQASFKCSWIDEHCIKKCILPEIKAIANNPEYDCTWPKDEGSIFQAFSIIDRFPRLVIMGQDPYPNKFATGIAFEVSRDGNTKTRKALKALSKSLEIAEGWFDIKKWAKDNAILLVNAALSYSSQSDLIKKQYRVWRSFWGVIIRILMNSNSITVLSLGRESEKLFKDYKQQLGRRFFYSPHPSDRHGGFNMTKSGWKEIQRLASINLPISSTDDIRPYFRSDVQEGVMI